MRAPVQRCDECELNAGGRCVFAKKTLRAGAVMTSQGALPAEVGFLRSGVVSLSMVSGAGEQTWSALRGPRSLIGVEALDGAPAAFEVRTLTAVEVCAASLPSAQAWVRSPGGSRALLGLALAEVRAQQRDVDFRTGSPPARVARFVAEYEPLIGTNDPERPLSKARVAELVGMRPETLSRVLGQLRGGGCLDARPAVRVLDRAALEAVADT